MAALAITSHQEYQFLVDKYALPESILTQYQLNGLHIPAKFASNIAWLAGLLVGSLLNTPRELSRIITSNYWKLREIYGKYLMHTPCSICCWIRAASSLCALCGHLQRFTRLLIQSINEREFNSPTCPSSHPVYLFIN